MAPATWSTPRRGACSVPRDHPTPAADSPARRQAAEVKMVGCITIAHGIAQRLSEKRRHFASASFVINFCTSTFCVGVAKASSAQRLMSLLAWRSQTASAGPPLGFKAAPPDRASAPPARPPPAWPCQPARSLNCAGARTVLSAGANNYGANTAPGFQGPERPRSPQPPRPAPWTKGR